MPEHDIGVAGIPAESGPPRTEKRREPRGAPGDRASFPAVLHLAKDPAFETRVRDSLARQRFMTVLGARLAHIAPGEVDLVFPFRDDLTQQHGFVHAGAVAAVADSACGYAALTLMEPNAAVLSVEFKVNLLAPAAGDEFVARGLVVRSGRNLTVCTAEVHARRADGDAVVMLMQATMMTVRDRAGFRD
jgi:uncharacterized protein (TIGR00369 family)